MTDVLLDCHDRAAEKIELIEKKKFSDNIVFNKDTFLLGFKSYKDENKGLRQLIASIFQKPEVESTDCIVYKELLLDFLFDINHSEVFQSYEQFDETLSTLMNNTLFKAIAFKYEFFYQKNISENKDNEFIALQYLKAQERWLGLMVNDVKEETINRHNKWFKSIDQEYKLAFIHKFTAI